MKEQRIPLAPLGVPRDFSPADRQIADALKHRFGLPLMECGRHPLEDELICAADIRKPRIPRERQDERIRQAAGALENRSAAARAPEHRHIIPFTGGDIDVVDETAGRPQHHEVTVALPEAQDRITPLRIQFFEQGDVQREILHR